ncbi:hypothetical protein [Burkholderia gladioli]|uniref:hypothetical protein n=1 Tax=Burkholderia gladioli TaxID=28095 RepID=UPI0016402252|nr:hypothetical protein [Burkholderia gladioli]
MNKPGLVTISMNELQRVKVIESVVEGRLTGVSGHHNSMRPEGHRPADRIDVRAHDEHSRRRSAKSFSHSPSSYTCAGEPS